MPPANCAPLFAGTLPVLFLIAPTCAAGAFQLKVGEGGNWKSLADTMLSVAGLVQAAALTAACYFIEDTSNKHSDELQRIPDDPEVAKADAEAARKSKLRRAATEWRLVPVPMRLLLVAGTVAAVCSAGTFQIMATNCFHPFEVTTKLADPPTYGKILNVLKPLGTIAMKVFVFSCVCLYLFGVWAKCHAKGFREDRDEKNCSKGSGRDSLVLHADVSDESGQPKSDIEINNPTALTVGARSEGHARIPHTSL